MNIIQGEWEMCLASLAYKADEELDTYSEIFEVKTNFIQVSENLGFGTQIVDGTLGWVHCKKSEKKNISERALVTYLPRDFYKINAAKQVITLDLIEIESNQHEQHTKGKHVTIFVQLLFRRVA